MIVILLIIVGSVTVIYNSFAISVTERKKQLGMLASVGATPLQIRKTVFFEGLVLGLAGIPLGILSGVGGIGVTLSVVNRLIIEPSFGSDVTLRLVVTPAAIVITVFFVALIIFLSAFIPAAKASRTSPIEAIRLNQDINVQAKKLRTSRITRFLFGFEGELALKNLKRNHRRYRATVFSLVISIVLFISFSSFMKYGFRSSHMYYGDMPFNVAVGMYDLNVEEQRELIEQIVILGGVERYAAMRSFSVQAHDLLLSQIDPVYREYFVDGGTGPASGDGPYSVWFTIVALGEQEFKSYTAENRLNTADFEDAENIKGILVNTGVVYDGKWVEYEPLKLRKGDRIQLTEAQHGAEHLPASFAMEIGAVTYDSPLGMSSNAIFLIVSDEALDGVVKLLDENTRRQTEYIHLYLRSKNSAGLVEEIRDLNTQKSSTRWYIQDMEAGQEEERRAKTAAAIFLYGFVALITLIGVTNIFNTVSTNVALRRREFAMLKSVGLTPGGFNKMINYESTFYGLKALAYGLPISLLVSYLMHGAFGRYFDFRFILPLNEIAAAVAGVFVIVFITMVHAGARLKRENIVDALKEENL